MARSDLCSGSNGRETVLAALQVDEAAVRAVSNSWGTGKFYPAPMLDGNGFRPGGEFGAALLSPALDPAGVNPHACYLK